jgi:RimJ/RimL family protein N-acetyltransferase
MPASKGPAYRIETPRTRLRCYQPGDHVLQSRAISESLDHLLPWMPWALHEPRTEGERIEWLRTQRGHFDLGGDYFFGIFAKDESSILGGTGLHMRGDVDEREIGYWIHASHIGVGLATEVTAALLRVAFELEHLVCVEIKCHVANVRSKRIPERLGFAGPVLEPLSLPWPGEGKADAHVYSLSRVEYARSEAQHLAIEAYDVLDRRLL